MNAETVKQHCSHTFCRSRRSSCLPIPTCNSHFVTKHDITEEVESFVKSKPLFPTHATPSSQVLTGVCFAQLSCSHRHVKVDDMFIDFIIIHIYIYPLYIYRDAIARICSGSRHSWGYKVSVWASCVPEALCGAPVFLLYAPYSHCLKHQRIPTPSQNQT